MMGITNDRFEFEWKLMNQLTSTVSPDPLARRHNPDGSPATERRVKVCSGFYEETLYSKHIKECFLRTCYQKRF